MRISLCLSFLDIYGFSSPLFKAEMSLNGAIREAPKLKRALQSPEFDSDMQLQLVDRQFLCTFECLFASMWPVASFLWLTASLTNKHLLQEVKDERLQLI